ncbi:MAG: hypothetical protein WCJ58_08620 [bacterium]
MKKIQLLTILFFSGLIACNNIETDSGKLILNKNIIPTQNEKNEVLTNETITDPDSTKNNSSTVFSVSEQTKKKRDKKSEEVDFLAEGVQREEQNNIITGFVRSVFIIDGNNYHFKRVVKQDEDRRFGCSSGGNELSFTIMNPPDTFLIENEMLKTLNFNYQINGGLYWENGESPHKGKVKGMLLPDKTWQIEINLWIKMTDLQLNKEIERQIIINDKFIL